MANATGGSVIWNFDADSAKFDRKLADSSEAADNFGKKLNKLDFKSVASSASSSFGSIADGIQGLVTKVAALTVGAGGLGAVFVKSAADLQTTSQSMKVLIGNTDVANSLFSQLATYANSTPFEFPQIAKAGQTLLGFGITADQVFGRVQILGDVAAATGADFQSLALVYGQVNAAGRLYGQDALQLINNSIPIYNILAKQMGISVKDVRDKMEDGAITADIFNAALKSTTTEGGFAFNGVDVLAQSFNGRLSTLKDTVLEFGRNLIGVKVDPKLGLIVEPGGIFDQLGLLLPKIGTTLKELQPRIQAVFSWLLKNGDTVKAAIIAIAVAFVAAKVAAIGFAIAAAPTVGLIAAGVIALIAVLVFLQVRFDFIGTAINAVQVAWAATVSFFQSTIASIKGWFNDLIGGTLIWFKDRISDGKAAIDVVKQGFQDFLAVVQGILQAIGGWIDDNSTAIRNWAIVIGTLLLPKFTQIAVQAAIAAFNTIASWASAFASMVAGGATASASAVKDAAISSAAWVKNAALATAAWIKNFPAMIAQMAKAAAASVVSAIKAGAAWIAQAAQMTLRWGIAFGAYLLQLGVVVLQTGLAALRLAASWLLAMGPIGLIVAAVIGIGALIIANWDTVKGWFNTFWSWLTGVVSGFVDWVKANWPLLLAIITGPIGLAALFIIRNWDEIKAAFANVITFFGDMFTGAWNAIKNAFSAVGSFFQGVWNTIKNIFTTIGSAIGDAIGGAFKFVVNSILGFAERTINGFINSINGAIGAINKIPGVNISKVSTLSIPRLADGGIVNPTPGGILANIGEGGQSEAIIPLDRLASMMKDYSGKNDGPTIENHIGTINIASEVDGENWLQKLTRQDEITRAGMTA